MTSPSREAFESALTRAIKEQQDPRFYSTIDAINWAWDAAIQHARDVAVKACEKIENEEWDAYKGRSDTIDKDKLYNPHVQGVSDGAGACADAIKEALK